MNYFDVDGIAKRYALSRPYFQPQVIELVRKHLNVAKVETALDVGCGTGQSTEALMSLANHAIGTDLSKPMVDQAKLGSTTQFLVCPAHQQPFADQSFDIITASMAYHWFDQSTFLTEAHRLLRPQGVLVIYNASFAGVMANNESFSREMREYYDLYPAPKRHPLHPTSIDLQQAGFVGIKQDFEFWQPWALPQFIGYLLTQTSAIERLQSPAQNVAQIETEIVQRFRRYFTQPAEQFLFRGDVSILKLER